MSDDSGISLNVRYPDSSPSLDLIKLPSSGFALNPWTLRMGSTAPEVFKMTKPKRYKRYSAEFKKEAILRAAEEGITDKAVCEELGISTRQFRRWHVELEVLGKDAFPGKGKSRDEEVTALKRELAQVKKERDFLKEAAAYFAKDTK